MVFKKDAKTVNKKNNEEVTDDPEVAADANGEEEIPKENGEAKGKKTKASTKKPPTKKSIDKPSAGEDADGEDSKEGTPKENGDAPAKGKKTKAVAKKASSRKSIKIVVPGERKSSRPHKPVTKEGDESEAYEVEKLVDSRVVRGKTEYLVRWKGYSRGDDTWEKESALTGCPELVSSFKAEHPAGAEKAKKRKSTSKSPVRPKKKAKVEKKKKQDDYEVEEIVGLRMKNGKKEFKVHWKGYSNSEDTWEPEKNLSCQDLIKTYIAEHGEEVEALKPTVKKTKKPLKKKTPTKSKKSKKTKAK